MVAGALRAEILGGVLKDGDSLPRMEDLMTRFSAGLPAVREALRILELEGLISMRRGNQGGAIVHLPALGQFAYMGALVLQSRETKLQDVALALQTFEPLCARMCAERPDRAKTLVPTLQAAVDALYQHVGSSPTVFNEKSHDFHNAVVDHCGNEATRMMVGALVLLWSSHERAYTEAADRAGTFPGRSKRVSSCDAHARILEAIIAGDGDLAARRSAVHASAVHEHHFGVSGREMVSAVPLLSFYLPQPGVPSA